MMAFGRDTACDCHNAVQHISSCVLNKQVTVELKKIYSRTTAASEWTDISPLGQIRRSG